MLMQTNSYIVPKDKRAEHERLLRRFRQTLLRLGCDHFEVYEQVGANWNTGENTGRFVQIMRFRDRKHQLAVQAAERTDPSAQALVNEFCDLINFSYQVQQGLFAVRFYSSFLKAPTQRTISAQSSEIEGTALAPVDVEAGDAIVQVVQPDGGDAPMSIVSTPAEGEARGTEGSDEPLTPEEIRQAQRAMSAAPPMAAGHGQDDSDSGPTSA
jgi:hypothetical protein